MAGNLQSSLRRRRSPMAEFDRLPPELRHWLAHAALPWSARSALRLWQRAARQYGPDPKDILAHLARAEARSLERDCPAIWGDGYPLLPAQARKLREAA
ncbi:DUF6525 family protein [Roseinatronobacter alkalisoli]|uniref:DUF6525 family protein n=1 Tax=Roseinatronobacter alkalisoli TaxID=3028235 RepID=A0ABT5TE29_9RHOB|nr:DUF6525 family protein [Roseinatronobacter sp. HJB301]MDD7972631.1 DUF6525 family protein [Roseinatronobacter sp. HJB301]